MAPVQAAHTDSRIIESRQTIPEPQPRYPALVPPSSPEELTLRLLGVRSALQPDGADYGLLAARQSNGQSSEGVYPIQLQYQNGGATPAAVVGITLGSVAGFLILIWLLWTLSNSGSFIKTTGDLEEKEIVRTRSTRSKRARSRREVQSRSGSSPQRVYRSERIVRDFPPPSARSRSRSPSIVRERDRSRTIIVEESRPDRRVDGDDIIEVMEEHSSLGAPRRKSRRQSSSRRY